MPGGEEVVVLPPLLHLHLRARPHLSDSHADGSDLPLHRGIMMSISCLSIISRVDLQSDADQLSDEEKQRIKDEAKKLRLQVRSLYRKDTIKF